MESEPDETFEEEEEEEEDITLTAQERVEAKLLKKQKLKEGMHYHVGKIAESHRLQTFTQNPILNIPKETISVLTEFICDYTESFGFDLESFARHAKRTTVNSDDVKLCARKVPELQRRIAEFSEKMNPGGSEKKAGKRKNGQKSEEPKSKKTRKGEEKEKEKEEEQVQQTLPQQHNNNPTTTSPVRELEDSEEPLFLKQGRNELTTFYGSDEDFAL